MRGSLLRIVFIRRRPRGRGEHQELDTRPVFPPRGRRVAPQVLGLGRSRVIFGERAISRCCWLKCGGAWSGHAWCTSSHGALPRKLSRTVQQLPRCPGAPAPRELGNRLRSFGRVDESHPAGPDPLEFGFRQLWSEDCLHFSAPGVRLDALNKQRPVTSAYQCLVC